MTIKSKLNLIILMVVSFALTIIMFAMYKAYNEKVVISQASELNILSQKLSLLIHETQKERGASAGFIGSKGKKFTDILPKQRTLTDAKNSELKSYIETLDLEAFPRELKSEISAFTSDMNKIGGIRSRVDSLSISVKDEVGYYTAMNKKILNIVAISAKSANTQELVKALDSYTNFLKSKERAGVERAVLSATFASDKFGNGMFAKWITLVAEQNAYLDSSLAMADEHVKDFYKTKMNSSAVEEVNRMRKIAKNNAATGGFGIDSVVWFKTITSKINLLKAVDDEISKQNTILIKKIDSASNVKAVITLVSYIAFAIIIFVIALLVNRSVTKSVGSSLEKIKCVSTDLDLTCNVVVEGKDEISQISQALHTMIVAFKSSVLQANSVANTTTDESNKLNNIVQELTKNGKVADDKITVINSLLNFRT